MSVSKTYELRKSQTKCVGCGGSLTEGIRCDGCKKSQREYMRDYRRRNQPLAAMLKREREERLAIIEKQLAEEVAELDRKWQEHIAIVRSQFQVEE